MNTQTATPAKINTIDIQAREWFDKVNGNSYFAGTVTTNYGQPDAQVFKMPFQYGYGSFYEQEARQILFDAGLIPSKDSYSLQQSGIVIRSNIQRNCLKRDLKNI